MTTLVPTDRSKALSAYIREQIVQNHAAISFADYMELALYHPEWGYYNAENFTLGKQGDFITAPEISSLFAKCLARQIQQIANLLPASSILELGAGTARLAHDLLIELNHLECLPQHYFIYEISQGLRKQQQAFLKSTLPSLFPRIIWLDTLPENFSGTIIANEVLDALPVNLFRVSANGIREKYVDAENEQFIWKEIEPADEHKAAAIRIAEQYQLSEGYEFEINFYLDAFIAALAQSLGKGIILFSDYGYGEREYYHPERKHGTLTCFHQHQQNEQPLIMTGLQDMTAHVDFTRVIEKAAECGLSLAGYTSQAGFLLACGLSEQVMNAEKSLNAAEQVGLHHAVKILTLPTEMGERIKFMALSKGMDANLTGFQLQDRRREL